MAYKTLVGTLAGFKEVGVPAQVDNSVLLGKSGSAQSAIKVALEFFGAIESDGTKRPTLDEMVGALGTPEWKSVLRSLLENRYGPIVEGLDLRNGTSRQLERYFSEAGLKGSSLGKAIRFYLQALDDAGIPRSPHFKAPPENRSSRSTSSPPPPDKSETKREEREEAVTPSPADGMEQVAVNLPGRTVPCVLTFHEDIRPREWDHVIGQLQGYWLLKADPDDEDD